MDHEQSVRERLAHEDPEFRQLVLRHHDYERQLERLRERGRLSPDEQFEEVRLKKLKLAVKDEMEAILRAHAR
jgi:uncharacterized protein YdcH (DUF465 family)